MNHRAFALAVLLVVTHAASTHAQGIVGQIGRFYDDGGWTLYRVGMSRPLMGPLGLNYHGEYFRRVGGSEGAFAGAGVDVTAFRTGLQGPYAVAGVDGGLGSPHSRSFSSVWGSWSVGGGYDLLPAPFLSFGAELRWREISLDNRGGLELAAGFGLQLGGGRRPGGDTDKTHDAAPDVSPAPVVSHAPAPAVSHQPAPVTGVPAQQAQPPQPSVTPAYASAALADSVVETATQMMGRKYEYGGTGEEGDGFDCSGLIQYAYAQHGITLPRRSSDQAMQGRGLPKNPDTLRPGDLLTFSSSGGPVTHVALYIGNGQFIHSASAGVQISLLSPDDPNGRWWYQRWVGARRILGA